MWLHELGISQRDFVKRLEREDIRQYADYILINERGNNSQFDGPANFIARFFDPELEVMAKIILST